MWVYPCFESAHTCFRHFWVRQIFLLDVYAIMGTLLPTKHFMHASILFGQILLKSYFVTFIVHFIWLNNLYYVKSNFQCSLSIVLCKCIHINSIVIQRQFCKNALTQVKAQYQWNAPIQLLCQISHTIAIVPMHMYLERDTIGRRWNPFQHITAPTWPGVVALCCEQCRSLFFQVVAHDVILWIGAQNGWGRLCWPPDPNTGQRLWSAAITKASITKRLLDLPGSFNVYCWTVYVARLLFRSFTQARFEEPP